MKTATVTTEKGLDGNKKVNGRKRFGGWQQTWNCHWTKIVGLYDRRMAIEEQFRDAKGVRFGMKLKWTQFTKAEFVERMFLLVGIAMMLWTSVGRAVEKENPKVRLKCKRKGARLSLVRVGFYYWQKVTEKVELTKKFVQEHLPPPRIRLFKWLIVKQN